VLDFSCLQVEGALATIGCETQGVENTTRVLSSVHVSLSVAVYFGASDQKCFDDSQLTAQTRHNHVITKSCEEA
jgi:hypothetical protein